jgi:hypothetical protein
MAIWTLPALPLCSGVRASSSALPMSTQLGVGAMMFPRVDGRAYAIRAGKKCVLKPD